MRKCNMWNFFMYKSESQGNFEFSRKTEYVCVCVCVCVCVWIWLLRWSSDKECTCQCRRHRRCRFHSCLGKIPRRRKWQPLQYSCLGKPMDRGAWLATIHRIAESTMTEQLSTLTYACTHTHTYTHILWVSLVAQLIKNLPAMQETLVQFLGQEDSPGEGIGYPMQYSWASLVSQMLKNPPTMWKTWVGKIPWRRAWQPTPVFLPGESPWTWRVTVHGVAKSQTYLSN